MSSKTLFSLAVFLIVLVTTVAGGRSSRSRSKTHRYDLSKASDLRKLYNSGVHRAERVRRPLNGWPFALGPLSHSGVRVTLDDGSQWLVHKGGDFGVRSQTVVVDAQHMSDRWKSTETKDFGGRKTVSDLVNAGGSEYKLFRKNCHQAATGMMN